jgi:hypothetical protein
MSLLHNLQKYAITKDFFEAHKPRDDVRKPEERKKKVNTDRKPVKTKEEYRYSSLFWTVYSLLENEHIKSMMENHEFKIKNDFSMKFVEEIKNNKGFLKQNKLKFHDIESSMLYDSDIDINTLKAIILFRKKNVFYLWNNRYYLFESNDDDRYDVIIRDKESYTFCRELSKNDIMKDKVANKLLMENTRTQLKSLSAYKLEELKRMAKILGIDTETKKTKQKLYEEINSKID